MGASDPQTGISDTHPLCIFGEITNAYSILLTVSLEICPFTQETNRLKACQFFSLKFMTDKKSPAQGEAFSFGLNLSGLQMGFNPLSDPNLGLKADHALNHFSILKQNSGGDA